jgi:hypothetical protein
MSDYVPVPDNQEVFNDPELDATAVLEILERTDQPDSEVIAYLFLDLARNNDSDAEGCHSITATRTVSTTESPGLQSFWPKFLLVGEQWVKPNQSFSTPRDQVKILLFLVRIPEAETDLLCSVNLPRSGKSDIDFQAAYLRVESAVVRLMQSLKINDMRLFVN